MSTGEAHKPPPYMLVWVGLFALTIMEVIVRYPELNTQDMARDRIDGDGLFKGLLGCDLLHASEVGTQATLVVGFCSDSVDHDFYLCCAQRDFFSPITA